MYWWQYKSMHLCERVMLYIVHAIFSYITCLQHIKLDHDFLCVLIERGSHTFHFLGGKMAPILEDIIILLSLPINEKPITAERVCD
jgi:hypothetical protein